MHTYAQHTSTHKHAYRHTQGSICDVSFICKRTSVYISQCRSVDFDVSSHFVEKVRPRTSSTSDADVKRQPAEPRVKAQTQVKGRGGKKGVLPTSKSRGTKQADSHQRHTAQVFAIHCSV